MGMGQGTSRKRQLDLDCASRTVLLPTKLRYLAFELFKALDDLATSNRLQIFPDIGVMGRGVTLRLARRFQQ